jgi:2'-5' RNA ligase
VVSEPPPADADSARVFVGIKLAPEIACELATIAKELEHAAIQPVSADDMHLTLVPPWQEDSIAKTIETLRRVATGFVAFVLVVQHVGYGPDPRRPRLLWADCAAVDELEALRAALMAAYAQDDQRPYRPHLTLARIRGNGRAIARRHPMGRPVAFRQSVDSVQLFRSPPPGERGYQILASVPLSKAQQSSLDR